MNINPINKVIMPIVIGYFIGKTIAELFIGMIKLVVAILTLTLKYIVIPGLKQMKSLYLYLCDIFDNHFKYRNDPAESISI